MKGNNGLSQFDIRLGLTGEGRFHITGQGMGGGGVDVEDRSKAGSICQTTLKATGISCRKWTEVSDLHKSKKCM